MAKYKEVVAASGYLQANEHCVKCDGKNKTYDLTDDYGLYDYGLGEISDEDMKIYGFRPGYHVEVVYRYAKKPWKRGK